MTQQEVTNHTPTPGCDCLACQATTVAQGLLDAVRDTTHRTNEDRELVARIAGAIITARAERSEYERTVLNAARSYRRAQHNHTTAAFERCSLALLTAARQPENNPTPETLSSLAGLPQGALFRIARVALAMSQKDLAAALTAQGHTTTHGLTITGYDINAIERGQVVASPELADALGRTLGLIKETHTS